MTPQDGITTLTDAQLERMLDRAAQRGASEALKAVGLGDENAGPDIREVRTLLTAWRDTKRAAWQQAVKIGTTALLGMLALGAWAYMSGGQK